VGQTENTGCCDGLMHKNGEQKVDEFVCAESRCLFVCGKSSVMILTPNRLWNISKVCVMQDKL
jgi:hypothetical protein